MVESRGWDGEWWGGRRLHGFDRFGTMMVSETKQTRGKNRQTKTNVYTCIPTLVGTSARQSNLRDSIAISDSDNRTEGLQYTRLECECTMHQEVHDYD